MTRNAKDACKTIFQRLADVIRKAGLSSAVTSSLDADRWIVGSDDDQKALVSSKILEFCHVDNYKQWAILTWQNDYYFAGSVVLDSKNDDLLEDEWVESEITNPGLIAALWSEGWPLSRRPAEDIAEYVFYKDGTYSLDEVAPFFLTIGLWKLRKAIPTWSLRSRAYALAGTIAAYARRTNHPDEYLPTAHLLTALHGNAGGVAGEQLWRAIHSLDDRHAFLELFRALEGLARLPYLTKLADALGTNCATLDNALESTLSWHPRAEEAIAQLFAGLDDTLLGEINLSLSLDGKWDKVAKRLTFLRNHIAHLRLGQIAQSDKLGDLAPMMGVLLKLIDAVYVTYYDAIWAYFDVSEPP